MENKQAASVAITLCANWVNKLCSENLLDNETTGISAPRFWVFGSTIYKEGDQFDSKNSDIDLVCLMPAELENAAQRTRWTQKLREQVVFLESQLAQALDRSASNKSSTSIVLVTQLELSRDIHKTVQDGFFTKNLFLSLEDTQASPKPFKLDKTKTLPEKFRTAASFVQTIRNSFLLKSPNPSQEAMPSWNSEDQDPIKKSYMRTAAQVFSTERKQHDVAEGLEYISSLLFNHREEDPMISELHEIVSVRRKARGSERPVTPMQQLLLAELIFDEAIDILNVEQNTIQANSYGNGLPLPVLLKVSVRGRLVGSDESIEENLYAAAVNLKWGMEPAFKLEFLELTNDFTIDTDSNLSLRQSAAIVDRRNELSQRIEKAMRGVRYIIKYWRQLFPEYRNDEMKYLKASVSGFLRNIVRGYANNGIYDLYVEFIDETTGDVNPIVASLGLPRIVEERWYSSLGISEPIELSRPNNQFATSLPPEIVAAIVIPQIVYRITELEQMDGGLSAIAPIESVLTTGRWLIGLH
jgi:hypothetical protein